MRSLHNISLDDSDAPVDSSGLFSSAERKRRQPRPQEEAKPQIIVYG